MRKRDLERVLGEIQRNEISRADAARALDVSERQVNRIMLAHGVSRSRSQAAIERNERAFTAEQRRAMRIRGAEYALSGIHSISTSAGIAGCSERTLRRWMAKLKKSSKNARNRSKSR